MNDVNDTLPVQSDDISSADQEQALLDAVMANSPIMDEVPVPLPTEVESDIPDPEESAEDPEEVEEAVSEEEEEVEEDVEEEEVEDADDESATQDADVFTADDLDLDAQVTVKIDGEELNVSFGDLIKGYQTDAHLSKKGRELGEAQKELDAEREQKMQEVDQLAQATAAMLGQTETAYAGQYKDLEKQIEKARADGDTYELNELKDKREQAQQRYWDARRRREGLMQAVAKQQEEIQQRVWEEQINLFQEEIPNLIPNFDEKVATDIREFALNDMGLNAEILDSIMDPKIVYAMHDYMQLKKGIQKGVAKRKAVPSKKAVPTKKARPATKKKEDADKMVKARAMREDASQEDQMAFLRQHASKTLNL